MIKKLTLSLAVGKAGLPNKFFFPPAPLTPPFFLGEGSLAADGSIKAEIQVITGATNELGYTCLSARGL